MPAIPVLKDCMNYFTQNIVNLDDRLRRFSPLALTTSVSIIIISGYNLKELYRNENGWKNVFSRRLFKLLYLIPSIRRYKESELANAVQLIQTTFDDGSTRYQVALPESGLSPKEIIEKASTYQSKDKQNYRKGLVSGTVYSLNSELHELMSSVFSMFQLTNPLHADLFPDVRQMDAEIVRMCLDMFHGDAQSCGTTTSGGTESIMMAMRTYRQIAYEKGNYYPEIVAPVTAHAAFDKAADYFKLKLVQVPIDPVTQKVNIALVRRAITSRTCCIVGSAPNFPSGIMDDIEQLAQIGLERGVHLHVDACLGGFLLPFLASSSSSSPCSSSSLGLCHVPPFDFALAGVSSISCDTHKYGCAPKGTSVILYRDAALRSRQFFASPDWPGGIYTTPSIAGSRPGSLIASCWAAMLYHGRAGYTQLASRIYQAVQRVAEGVRATPGLELMGEPLLPVVAFRAVNFDVYQLLDRLMARGWYLNPIQYPSGLHLCVTQAHVQCEQSVQQFVTDLQEASRQLMQTPREQREAEDSPSAIYGTSQKVPDRSLIKDIGAAYLSAYYSTGGERQD